MNRLVVSFQDTARSTAARSVKIERVNTLRLLEASLVLDVGVLLNSFCRRASEDIYQIQVGCTDRSDAQILVLTRNIWKRRQVAHTLFRFTKHDNYGC